MRKPIRRVFLLEMADNSKTGEVFGGAILAKAERNPAAFDRFVRPEIARWAPSSRRPERKNEAMGKVNAEPTPIYLRGLYAPKTNNEAH